MWYQRTFWIQRIERAWSRANVVWLAGVRRVGKTVLCRSLPEIEYFDCELSSVRRQLRDPETFFQTLKGKRVVLDEVHRLPNPSEVLKIVADHYPEVRVLATGSSTLEASSKFRDTLAGRRRQVLLTPMIQQDLADFQSADLTRRLHRGGLPPFFLALEFSERDVQDWMDAYWAKDLEALFRLERRDSFLMFVELLLARSGSMFESSGYARECGVSHNTIRNYLAVLEATFAAHRLRPYSRRAATEIVAAPKVYGFDTGFVCVFRGWQKLRLEDLGILWEHYVLNELQARLETRRLYYWRDKRGHEVDIVLPVQDGGAVALECKWNASGFEPRNLLAFRRRHPAGENFVVAADIRRPWVERQGEIRVEFVSLEGVVARLLSQGAPDRQELTPGEG